VYILHQIMPQWSMLNLAFIFAIVCGLFDTKRICTVFFYFTLNGLTPPHVLCLSQAGTYIFNTICHGLFRANLCLGER
jgi:hypothetical protein